MSLVKQRNQSIEAFTQGNRPDLAEKESKELEIIQSYLPSQLSETEIRDILSKFYSDNQFDNRNKAMGMGMGYMNKNYSGQFDNKKVNEIINTLI